MAGTAEDLVRFCLALDHGTLLRPDTVKHLYQPAQLNDGTTSRYGLGWNIRQGPDGALRVAHSGGAMGGTTYLLHDPGTRSAVAILANAQNVKGLADLAARLLDSLDAL
jgi:hypothetical protein